jgi:hypothetical protein
MNKRVLISLGFVLLISTQVQSQQLQASSQGNSNSVIPTTSTKILRLSGVIGEAGNTLTSDKDHRTWHVSNGAVLRESEGQHVRVKARISVSGDELFITSFKFIRQQTVTFNRGDSAFRR